MTPLRIESKGKLADGTKAKGLLIKIVQDCEGMTWQGVVINDDGEFEIIPIDSIRCIDPGVPYDMRFAPTTQQSAYPLYNSTSDDSAKPQTPPPMGLSEAIGLVANAYDDANDQGSSAP